MIFGGMILVTVKLINELFLIYSYNFGGRNIMPRQRLYESEKMNNKIQCTFNWTYR